MNVRTTTTNNNWPQIDQHQHQHQYFRIREYWHRPDDVLVGFVIGLAAAHWSFQFVVLMPFRHEIGSPEWKMDPKWLEDEEEQWEEEEELLRLCGWASGKKRGKRGPPRIGASSTDDVDKAPIQVRRGAVLCCAVGCGGVKGGPVGRVWSRPR